jgi:hypothetical protein
MYLPIPQGREKAGKGGGNPYLSLEKAGQGRQDWAIITGLGMLHVDSAYGTKKVSKNLNPLLVNY